MICSFSLSCLLKVISQTSLFRNVQTPCALGEGHKTTATKKKKQKDKVCSVVHKTLHINIEIE